MQQIDSLEPNLNKVFMAEKILLEEGCTMKNVVARIQYGFLIVYEYNDTINALNLDKIRSIQGITQVSQK